MLDVTTPIITLCGSTRFKEEFEKVNADLTLRGFVVLSCGVFGHTDGVELTEEKKKELDKLHLRKIAMSHAIYVINKDGYIGESTKREIAYANKLGKPIVFLEKTDMLIAVPVTKDVVKKAASVTDSISKWFTNTTNIMFKGYKRCNCCGQNSARLIETRIDSDFGNVEVFHCEACDTTYNRYQNL